VAIFVRFDPQDHENVMFHDREGGPDPMEGLQEALQGQNRPLLDPKQAQEGCFSPKQARMAFSGCFEGSCFSKLFGQNTQFHNNYYEIVSLFSPTSTT